MMIEWFRRPELPGRRVVADETMLQTGATMTDATTKALYTIREAADLLLVSPALVYALCASRKIRHERHGLKRGRIRIPQDALDEYRRLQTVEAAAPPPPATPEAPIKLKHLRL